MTGTNDLLEYSSSAVGMHAVLTMCCYDVILCHAHSSLSHFEAVLFRRGLFCPCVILNARYFDAWYLAPSYFVVMMFCHVLICHGARTQICIRLISYKHKPT